ncbi:hypothetical protein QBC35DRAFT_89227 [Podospora australis]|uniref:Uncharacterized protein n=1 Tax=Podospora australis TaxID=1536484 RepID=A0AAN6X1E3_9PEZI|nr:hypothetical protein QBC35DRAFT_89227 [Podospora australis]
MTVIGPLTTTFTAPASCTTAGVQTQIYNVWNGTESKYVQGPLFPDDSDCFPEGYDAAPTNYYSPGYCPLGYTAACSGLETTSAVTETAIVCCPSHPALTYACGTDSASRTQPALACTTAWDGAEGLIEAFDVRNGTTASSASVATLTAGGVSAYGIQIRFKSGDPNPTALPSRTGSSPSASLQPPVIAPIDTTPSSTGSSSGLSQTALIGIAVGAALGGFIIFTSLCLWCYMRRRRKHPREPSVLPPADRQSQHSSRRVRYHGQDPPPVPPKELSTTPSSLGLSYRAVPPPYELSEDVSPRFSPASSPSKRHLSMSSPSSPRTFTTLGHTRGDSGVMYGVGIEVPVPGRSPPQSPPLSPPAELEADVPSDSSLRIRAASPESGNSGWTDKQARGGVQPMPWI